MDQGSIGSRHYIHDAHESVEVRKPFDYHDRYREFLARTNEKEVIADALRYILMPGTVLDIGAGSGEVPTLLGIEPSRYTAIECQESFVRTLQEKGYTVINDLFPCPLDLRYSNVLLIYCLYSPDQCEAMIDAAWSAVSDGGLLVAVTFRDNLDDYNTILHRAGHTARGQTDTRYSHLVDKFKSLGPYQTFSTISHISTRTFEDLAHTVSFMATNSNIGTLQRRREVYRQVVEDRAYIDQRYLVRADSYRLPIRHFGFVARRSNTTDQ